LSLAINKASTLEGCLDDFFHDERIKEYKCDRCKIKGSAFKRMSFSILPKIMIFHLKRFKFFPKQHKLSQLISYKLEDLNLKKY
jgi:ubiquitin C-terminal hydrolase